MRKIIIPSLIGFFSLSISVFAQENELRALLESIDNAYKANDTVMLSSLFLNNNENDVLVSNACIKLFLMKPKLSDFADAVEKKYPGALDEMGMLGFITVLHSTPALFKEKSVNAKFTIEGNSARSEYIPNENVCKNCNLVDNFRFVNGKWYYSPYRNDSDNGQSLIRIVQLLDSATEVGTQLLQQNLLKDEFIAKLKSSLPSMQ